MTAHARLAPLLTSALLLSTSAATAAEPANAGFGQRGDLVLSVERISPLVVLEADRTGRGRIDGSRTLVGTLGDTPTPAPTERLPRLAVDAGLGRGWTLGGSVYAAHTWSGAGDGPRDVVGLAPRVGRAFLLGKGAVFWPHLGASYTATRTDTGTSARVELTLDGALGFFPSEGVAVTLTPALDVGIASSAPDSPATTGRFSVMAGLLGHLDGARSAGDARPPPARALGRPVGVVVSADRLLPLFDYERAGDGVGTASSGATHAATRDHALFPRFAADFVLRSGFTFGAAFVFNITPWEDVQTYAYAQGGRLVPGPRASQELHALSMGVVPRFGWLRALGDDLALWLRGGLTYALAGVLQPGYHAPTTTAAGTTLSAETHDAHVAHRLDLSLDPELIWFLTRGLGLTVGPVLDVTLAAAGADPRGYPHGLPGGPLLHAGATAGALVAF